MCIKVGVIARETRGTGSALVLDVYFLASRQDDKYFSYTMLGSTYIVIRSRPNIITV